MNPSPMTGGGAEARFGGALDIVYERQAVPFGQLVRAWSEHRAALPVAVVVSVFDDLLAGAPAIPASGDDPRLSLDDVLIDDAGVAQLRRPGRGSLAELSALLRDALAGGAGEAAIPPAAHAVLNRGLSSDPRIAPPDPEHLRAAIRGALGPPAAHAEVRGCLEPLLAKRPVQMALPLPMSQISTRPRRSGVSLEGWAGEIPSDVSDAPLPVPALVEDSVLPEPAPVRVPVAAPQAELTAAPQAELTQAQVEEEAPSAPVSRDAAPEKPRAEPVRVIDDTIPERVVYEDEEQRPHSLLPRVRIEPRKRRPVSLPAAPPARLGSLRAPAEDDDVSISLPREGIGRFLGPLLFLLIVAGGIAYALRLF